MLPAETTAPPSQAPELDPAALEAFVSTLCRKRDKAIAGRRSSGIEADWLEDEEYYQGIDDANRQFVRSWVASVKRGIPVTVDPTGLRSTVFLNITRPYVDAAAARLADMLLPADDQCWAIKPTPIAEIDPETTAQLDRLGVDWKAAQAQIQAKAAAAAELMSDAIEDHLEECGWHGEVRSVIEDASRIGCGVIKGPVPQKHTSKKWNVSDGGAALEVVVEINPGSVRIDPWNLYPDPACGESIHNGDYVFERAYITPKQLRDMVQESPLNPAVGVVFNATIAKVLKEGPKQLTAREASDGTYVPIEDTFESWLFYGVIAQQDAAASGLALGDKTPIADAMALLVNDELIKINLNALETGEYPYDVLAWQRRPGVPWGMGIGRHIRTPQRMLNAACRAMMDNAGRIAGQQEVIGNGVTPADGKYEVRGAKVWRADPEVVDVTKAFFCYSTPSQIDEFLKIIEFARSIAEQTTGMPMLLQGQQTESSTKTLGGMQLLQNNASGVLRRLAKRFDDYLTDPHIRRYYNWMMQYSPRSDIKGDFQIDVRASSALVERDATKQFMFAAMSFATNPAYGIDPYRLFAELAKSDRIDPKRIQFDEADYQKRLAPAPGPLEQAKTELTQAQAQTEQAKVGEVTQQTKLLEAKTAGQNLTTEYEAIQGGAELAVSPETAPIADQLLAAANFPGSIQSPPQAVDAGGLSVDAVKNHQTGVQFTPGSTHPNLPAPPPTGAVGAQAGIEGGGQ